MAASHLAKHGHIINASFGAAATRVAHGTGESKKWVGTPPANLPAGKVAKPLVEVPADPSVGWPGSSTMGLSGSGPLELPLQAQKPPSMEPTPWPSPPKDPVRSQVAVPRATPRQMPKVGLKKRQLRYHVCHL